jgi:hypothetical protein
MTTVDKWILTGAWAAMAAAAGLSYYSVSHSPRIEPGIAAAIRNLEQPSADIPKPPAVLRRDMLASFGAVAEVHPAAPKASVFRSRVVIPPPPPHEPVNVQVLPFPVMGDAKADLDGVRIAWTTEARTVELEKWMIRKPAKPEGFIVFRQSGDAAPVRIAELGPEARSYEDLSVQPKQTYRYWVAVKGLESDRAEDPSRMVPVTNRADTPVSARTPSTSKLKLVGGDKTHAMLKAETYNKERKCWLSKTVLVAPGETVAATGWTLKGLRFDDFTLVADLTDDDGVARVLTTRE